MTPPVSAVRKLYIGDNLAVMRGMDGETVDLIYLDPPFNSKSLYKGAMGSRAEKQQFSDVWKMNDINKDELADIKLNNPDAYDLIKLMGGINGESWYAYLTFMAVRLGEMRRILKKTGSIYLHCDRNMSAPLKLLLDIFFGERNFHNEIVWFYHDTPGRPKRHFARKHDVIYRYAKTEDFIFNADAVKIPVKPESMERYSYVRKLGGREYYEGEGTKIPESVWSFPAVKRNSKESTGWATQKPLALLKRIIRASSDAGGLVLDPFCGCATACIAAEQENRQWIGIDIDREAEKIMAERAKKDTNLLDIWSAVEIIDAGKTANLPKRTDIKEINKKDMRVKTELYRRQGGKCGICKMKFPLKTLEYDRKKPGKRGGRYTADNVELLCPTCNRVKGSGTRREAVRRIAAKRIFEELGNGGGENE